MKIENNQVNWIKHGERANPQTINRPLTQVVNKINEFLAFINDRLVYLNNEVDILKKGKAAKVENNPGNITEENLDSYQIKSSDVSVQTGLPVGWNCHIVAQDNDIVVDLVTENILENNSRTFLLNSGRTAKLVKVTNNKWIVSIERLILSVEEDQ